MNVILFGPPGVGKSTLIGALKSAGHRAVDLEDIYPNKMRFMVPSIVEDTFLGAADLNPKRHYTNCKKVLLFMKQGEYVKRRAQRDLRIPGKAAQKPQAMSDWMKGTQWDVILDASQPVKSLLRQLEEVMYGKDETRP